MRSSRARTCKRYVSPGSAVNKKSMIPNTRLQLIAEGSNKLASVPSGGGGGGGGGAAAPAAAGGADAGDDDKPAAKEEEKEESDEDMGFGLFD